MKQRISKLSKTLIQRLNSLSEKQLYFGLILFFFFVTSLVFIFSAVPPTDKEKGEFPAKDISTTVTATPEPKEGPTPTKSVFVTSDDGSGSTIDTTYNYYNQKPKNTPFPSPTLTPTARPTTTATPTNVPAPTTPVAAPTETPTPAPTATPTLVPTETVAPTITPAPTATPLTPTPTT